MSRVADSFGTTVEVSTFLITWPRHDYRVKVEVDDSMEIVSAYLSRAEVQRLRDALDQSIGAIERDPILQPELEL